MNRRFYIIINGFIIIMFISLFLNSCFLSRNVYKKTCDLSMFNAVKDSSTNEYDIRLVELGELGRFIDIEKCKIYKKYYLIEGYILDDRQRVIVNNIFSLPKPVPGVKIFLCQEKEKLKRLILIDTLGISNEAGKFKFKIPRKKNLWIMIETDEHDKFECYSFIEN